MAKRLYQNRFANTAQDQNQGNLGQQQQPPVQQQQYNNNTQPQAFANNNVQQEQPQQQQQNYQQQQNQQQQPQQQQQNNQRQQQQQQQQQFNNNNGQQQQQQKQNHHNNGQQQQQHQQQQQQVQGQQPQNKLKKQQSQKIDTDQIPRPQTTMQDSAEYKVFKTANGYSSAPQSHQFFNTVDEGNAGPRFIRASLNCIGREVSTVNNSQVPTGVIVTPFGEPSQFEEQVPVVDCTESQVQRCQRCKCYINPNWQYTDNGNTSVCNLCKMTQKTPTEYYCPLNEYRERSDKYSRPELSKGVYDILAPKEYQLKTCQSVCVMVCLEMSPASLQAGVFTQALNSIQSILDYCPAPEFTNISIMTFDKYLNFYNIPKDLNSELGLIIVSDLDDPYCPIAKEALYMNVQDDKEKILYLIEKLTKQGEALLELYENSKQGFMQCPGVGCVVKAVSESMNQSVGRILVFSSQFPHLGFGALKKRDETKLLNTENERQLYSSQSQVYTDLAKQLLDKRIGVDMFIFAQSCDLATISLLTTVTGGSLYYYADYDPNTDGERIHYDLFRNFTRTYAYDCMMTLRTSTGMVLHDYYTQCGKQSVRDLELSCLDSDKSIAIVFKQEEKIVEAESFIQYAVLYTNQFGQRVIRVINLSFQVTDNSNNLFRSADIDATASLVFRRVLAQLPTHSVKIMKDQLVNKTVSILHSYRVNCASQSSPGQLILPESLKMMGLLVNSLFKFEILRQGGVIKIDQRIAEFIKISSLPPHQLQSYLYPKLYPLHNIYENGSDEEIMAGNQVEEGKIIIPGTIATTGDKIEDEGLYLLASNDVIYLYIGLECNPEVLQHLFDTSDLQEIAQMGQIPVTDVDFNLRVNAIIDQVKRNKYGSYHGVKIVIQGDYNQSQFSQQLVEDNLRGIESYGDFLCNLHRLIQQKQQN